MLVLAMVIGAAIGIWRAQSRRDDRYAELIAMMCTSSVWLRSSSATTRTSRCNGNPMYEDLMQRAGLTGIHNGEVFLGVFMR